MVQLINKSQVSQYLQTAIGISDTEFNKYITEAIEFDIKELLCEDFYNDLLNNSADTKYQTLLDGGNYNYNSKNYNFSGLGKVIAYFAYARFINKTNFVSTSHGFVVKTTPHSEPMKTEDRRSHYHNYRKEANIIFKDVKKFIERNQSDYPDCNYDCSPIIFSDFKTRVIQ